MATVSFHFLGCFWLCFSLRLLIACSDGGCRKMTFPSFYYFAGKRLVKHDIKTLQVPSKDACEQLCFDEPNCAVSISFEGIADDNCEYKCELSNFTHQEHDRFRGRTDLLLSRVKVTKTLGPAFYLVIASQTLCVKLTGGSRMAIQRQDLNRVALFLKVKQGQVLSGHVISTHQVRSEMECLHTCLSRDKCMSFNYGLYTSKLRHICELNSGSRKSPGHVFETRDGFSYFEPSAMTLPQQDFVFHNQSQTTVDAAVESTATSPVISSIFSKRSSSSLMTSALLSSVMTSAMPYATSPQPLTCPLMSSSFIASSSSSFMTSIQPSASWDNSASSSAVQQVREAFLFPRKGVSDYVIVQGMPSLSELTACFWMRSSDQANDGTPLSYAVHGQDNEFTFLNYNSFDLYVGGKDGKTGVKANDGKWHHICATWENTAGSLNVYKDGNLEKRHQRLNSGHIISRGGSLVLGQTQDSVGGGFESRQSFIGEMTGVNIWNYVLGDQEVAALSNSCLEGEGNVFKWSDFKSHTRGWVQLINATCAA